MAIRATSGKPSPRPSRSRALLIVTALLASALTVYLVHRATAPAGTAVSRHIYSTTSDPHQQVADGLAQATREHKRVLLDFGGDWCGDCVVLDFYLHQPPNADLLAANFVLVHVYIGEHIDENLDIPAKYNVPVGKGVPALAVLDAQGGVLYSQTTGEFGHMRTMDPSLVTEFLLQWKA